MDETGKIVSAILKRLAELCVAGRTGKELDTIAGELIKEHGATSYNKNYHPEWAKVPFPANLCVSPNGVVVHGIPNDYNFKDGDIITLDIGIKKNGLCGDAAITVPIGEVSNANKRLIYYARMAVYEMLSTIHAGVNTRDIADHIHKWAMQRGLTMFRTIGGHAIGKEMHEKPTIYNTVEDEKHTYADLEEGQVICIEPILTNGADAMGSVLSDGWSRVTLDGKYAAQFEHMARITKDGYELLTDHFNDEI